MFLTKKELDETVSGLQHEEPRQRVIWLKLIFENPTGDPHLLPYLEALIEDKIPVLIGIPFFFGEVRWMAAYALAAEYKKQGIDKVIRLEQVAKPIMDNQLAQLAEAHGVLYKGGIEGFLEAFEKLRNIGVLPFGDFNFY